MQWEREQWVSVKVSKTVQSVSATKTKKMASKVFHKLRNQTRKADILNRSMTQGLSLMSFLAHHWIRLENLIWTQKVICSCLKRRIRVVTYLRTSGRLCLCKETGRTQRFSLNWVFLVHLLLKGNRLHVGQWRLLQVAVLSYTENSRTSLCHTGVYSD